jgi:protein SCO1
MVRDKRIWFLVILLIATGGLVYLLLPRLENPSAYEGTELTGAASDFQLTNQHGSAIRLSDFRGKVIVLTFVDSMCQDTCPLTAVQFRQVYKQLDKNGRDQVAFLGVNVNTEVNTVEDMLETSQAWHLDEIPTWHFLTGSEDTLEPVWKAYGVAAIHSHDGNSIVHTPGTFLIDRMGQKRWYISIPFSDEGAELSLPLSQLLVKHIQDLLR